MIFDTHIHLTESPIMEHLDTELNAALERGVTAYCCVGFDKTSSMASAKLALSYPQIYAAVGLQPEEIKKCDDLSLKWLTDLLDHPDYKQKIVAIGEIGLDYHWEKEDAALQKEIFRKQLDLAVHYNLPIIIHARDAIQDTYNILKEYPTVKGVMHCYSGSVEMAKEFVKLGYYLGIGGVVTFKNSKEIKEVVQTIGLDHLVSETDAPYLAPVPHRGGPNLPNYIRDTVDYIGELIHEDSAHTQTILYHNALNLFRLNKSVEKIEK